MSVSHSDSVTIINKIINDIHECRCMSKYFLFCFVVSRCNHTQVSNNNKKFISGISRECDDQNAIKTKCTVAITWKRSKTFDLKVHRTKCTHLTRPDRTYTCVRSSIHVPRITRLLNQFNSRMHGTRINDQQFKKSLNCQIS